MCETWHALASAFTPISHFFVGIMVIAYKTTDFYLDKETPDKF